jgi:metal-responsive CopG/Arc/MetJ family transcriptional regulator
VGDSFLETIRVRLPAGLRSRLDEAARREERTHSEIIRQALRKALEPARSESDREDPR